MPGWQFVFRYILIQTHHEGVDRLLGDVLEIESHGRQAGTNNPTIDTTIPQRPGAQEGLCTYRATKDNGPHANIWLDYSDDEHWWMPSAQWNLIEENIGAQWADNANPGGVEGPALFSSHSNDKVYLYVDAIPSIGYKPMVTTDPDHSFQYFHSKDFLIGPHTKHGGVLSLTKTEYDRLKTADGTLG